MPCLKVVQLCWPPEIGAKTRVAKTFRWRLRCEMWADEGRSQIQRTGVQARRQHRERLKVSVVVALVTPIAVDGGVAPQLPSRK